MAGFSAHKKRERLTAICAGDHRGDCTVSVCVKSELGENVEVVTRSYRLIAPKSLLKHIGAD